MQNCQTCFSFLLVLSAHSPLVNLHGKKNSLANPHSTAEDTHCRSTHQSLCPFANVFNKLCIPGGSAMKAKQDRDAVPKLLHLWGQLLTGVVQGCNTTPILCKGSCMLE